MPTGMMSKPRSIQPGVLTKALLVMSGASKNTSTSDLTALHIDQQLNDEPTVPFL